MNNAETIATAIEIMLNSEDPGAIAKIGRIIRTGFFKGGVTNQLLNYSIQKDKDTVPAEVLQILGALHELKNAEGERRILSLREVKPYFNDKMFLLL